MLRCEARRINPAEINAIPNTNPFKPHHALNQRLYRCLRHWDQSYRRGTHRAQNTRHCIKIINDFQNYVDHKIQRLGIPHEWVFNIDETNVPYSLEKYILEDSVVLICLLLGSLTVQQGFLVCLVVT